jgi:hypothetical protein
MTSSASTPSIMPLITGFMVSRLVYLAAELGIADLIAAGAVTAEALAERTGTHAPALRRVLRALCAHGVFSEPVSGQFGLGPLGPQLQSNIPGSVRNFARFFGDQRSWKCLAELEHVVRTGQTGMESAFGMDSFQYLSTHSAEAAVFNAAMADVTRQIARVAVKTYDFSAFRRIMDIGGGNGTFLAGVLRATSAASGVLFDISAGLTAAHETLRQAGVADRCAVVAGDFFKSVPANADLMMLKSVIHDWDDDRATEILRQCRAAASPNTKLLLIERIMPERMVPTPANQRGASLDIRMLAITGGIERTEEEYRRLLKASGFTATRMTVLPAPSDLALMEAVPGGPGVIC